jgi:hypothetical protein
VELDLLDPEEVAPTIAVLHEGHGRARITAILDDVLTRIAANYEVTTVSHLLATERLTEARG